MADHYSHLWHAVFSIIKHFQLVVTLHKVRAHVNNEWNNYIDHLAKQACNLSHQLSLLPSSSFLTISLLYNYIHIDNPMRPFLKQITQATRWFNFIQLKRNNKYKHYNIDWLCISKYIQGDEPTNSTSF